LDLKLLKWVQSPLKACRDKELRCVTDASVAHQTAGKQGPHHGKDVLRLEQGNGDLAMASERQIVAKPRPWPHAVAVNYFRNSHWRNSTKASFLSNIGKE